MANVGFQPSGDELEQALMDLGPLLGVNIKEEVTEEDANAAASRLNVPSAPDTNPGGGSDSGDGTPKAEGGADPLASIAGARCVLCQTTLAHTEGTPKLMECLHSACEPCVNAKIEEKQSASRDFLGAERITITCPACRLQCQPGNMIDQRFVIEKITADAAGNGSAVSGELQCNSCDDTEPATSYCVDCAEFICNNCVQAHQRLKITKDHTIKSKAEALADQQAAQSNRNGNEMFCNEHTQERLSLFCETCDRLTCRDCQLQHHRDHKYQFSSEMAAQARANISSLLSEVSYKRVLLGSAMKVIKDRQQLIADKKKALVHEITQTVVKLTNAINTRGKQLVLRLNEVCDSKQKTLSEKKDALEQLAAITDHCVEFVNGALQQGSDTAVLYTKRAVCAHLQRIKSRRADIPNPEIPVRITLAIDKLPDLLKVLSTIGGIVVDGKVEGGGGAAGGAQGPYHPPHAAAHAPPPHTAGHAVQLVPHASHAPHHQGSPHSAVVALQQVAMQQSYVTNHGANSVAVSGASSAVMSALQQQMRRATPLRHPHVTSTTHPHHVHGMNELNLRGLLNQSGAGNNMLVAMGVARGAAARPPAQHAMHHAYQQMIGAYASNAYAAAANNSQSGRRSVGGLRTPSPAPHYPAPPAPGPAPPPAKWHIPQHSLQHSGGFDMGLLGGSASAVPAQTDFKITLGRQHSAPSTPGRSSVPSAVTSTNPKTPSPSLNGAISSELDKVCAESVQDLMATIAKLDSNGVQVVAEPSPMPASAARSPAPSVHSSTDDNVGKPSLSGMVAPAALGAAAAPVGGGVGADPNEDWCAVCMDGGELMCCDKCPKVFHQYCHIPTIDKLPDETETWQCLLCVNFAEMPPEAASELREGQLSPRQMRIIERITLELYCQYEPSLAFREPVPLENLHYHEKISQPMCLDTIRMKLQPSSPARYTLVAHFVDDCRLMFRNALSYNPVESQIYKDAKRLEEFFEAQLMKWLPEYAYWSPGAMPQGASASFGEPGVKRARIE